MQTISDDIISELNRFYPTRDKGALKEGSYFDLFLLLAEPLLFIQEFILTRVSSHLGTCTEFKKNTVNIPLCCSTHDTACVTLHYPKFYRRSSYLLCHRLFILLFTKLFHRNGPNQIQLSFYISISIFSSEQGEWCWPRREQRVSPALAEQCPHGQGEQETGLETSVLQYSWGRDRRP